MTTMNTIKTLYRLYNATLNDNYSIEAPIYKRIDELEATITKRWYVILDSNDKVLFATVNRNKALDYTSSHVGCGHTVIRPVDDCGWGNYQPALTTDPMNGGQWLE